MKILLTFNVGGDDAWLRAMIRGTELLDAAPWLAQSVIVGDFREADRIASAMANLKNRRHKPYGGCLEQVIR